jgi:sugar O-acyltransferase (sialic acid O-acetyltransferase NeuD family)
MKNSLEKKEKIIIIGAGEFAQIAYEYFTHDSPYEVVAFSAEKEFITEPELLGLPVIPFEEIEIHYNPQQFSAYVAITYTQLNRVRARLYHEAKKKGYRFISYVSSHAFIWHNVEIGENTFIFENNVLQHMVKIGNNVVLWSGNHIGHRTIIRDHVYASSHCVISGYCDIGEYCFLGVNSTYNDKIKVAKDCIIGSGAVVVKNTEERKVYVGNPAKPMEKDSFTCFGVKEKLN